MWVGHFAAVGDKTDAVDRVNVAVNSLDVNGGTSSRPSGPTGLNPGCDEKEHHIISLYYF